MKVSMCVVCLYVHADIYVVMHFLFMRRYTYVYDHIYIHVIQVPHGPRPPARPMVEGLFSLHVVRCGVVRGLGLLEVLRLRISSVLVFFPLLTRKRTRKKNTPE